MAGADFLCATTPSEHLDLPALEDVVEGTYVTRIAAHAGDLTRPGVRERARERDLQMARARADLNWEAQFQAAINPALARRIRHRRGWETDTCTMCSELCAIRLAREAMERGQDCLAAPKVRRKGGNDLCQRKAARAARTSAPAC